MKKKCKVLIVALILCIGVQAQNKGVTLINQDNTGIELDFTLPMYSIEDTILLSNYGENQVFSYIKVDNLNYGITDSLGFPEMPQLTLNLCLPMNATNITVEFIPNKIDSIFVSHRILPTQYFVQKDTAFFNFIMDSLCYNSSNWVYGSNAFASESYSVFGEKGFSLTIIPFSYQPLQFFLKACLSARIRINYIIDDRIVVQQRKYTKSSESYLEKFFDNYTTRKSTLDSERYLMITDTSLESTLICFANYKRNIGYDVDVATTDNTGTTASDIKSYIQGRYDNVDTRPEYVLLVGDINIIPASDGDGSNYGDDDDNPLTDLNYARLDGDDYFADVFLGRFTVDDRLELCNIINKTILMENQLALFDNKVKLIAGDQSSGNVSWWRRQFEKAHNEIAENTFTPLGYDCEKLYQPNNSQVVQAIMDNPKYIIYSGHGNVYEWAGISFSLNASTLNDTTNTVYPFAFAFACRTGDYYYYESPRCMAKSWLVKKKGGAVTYFGSSVSTLCHPDYMIEKKMFYNDFTDEQSISSVVNTGKNGYWNSFWSTPKRRKRYMKSYNLFGDPSLIVNGNDCFTNFIFSNPEYFENSQNVDYEAENQIRNENTYTLYPGSTVNWKAGEQIRIKPGFHAEMGSRFVASIESCKKRNDNTVYRETSIEGNLNTNEISTPAVLTENTVYPNPATDMIVVSYCVENQGVTTISLINVLGVKYTLFEGRKDEGHYSDVFSLNNVPYGLYILNINTNGKQYNTKLIKQ